MGPPWGAFCQITLTSCSLSLTLADTRFTIYCYSTGGDTAVALSDIAFYTIYNIHSVTRERQCNGLGGACAVCVFLLLIYCVYSALILHVPWWFTELEHPILNILPVAQWLMSFDIAFILVLFVVYLAFLAQAKTYAAEVWLQFVICTFYAACLHDFLYLIRDTCVK